MIFSLWKRFLYLNDHTGLFCSNCRRTFLPTISVVFYKHSFGCISQRFQTLVSLHLYILFWKSCPIIEFKNDKQPLVLFKGGCTTNLTSSATKDRRWGRKPQRQESGQDPCVNKAMSFKPKSMNV